jgi:hypothetical protein
MPPKPIQNDDTENGKEKDKKIDQGGKKEEAEEKKGYLFRWCRTESKGRQCALTPSIAIYFFRRWYATLDLEMCGKYNILR